MLGESRADYLVGPGQEEPLADRVRFQEHIAIFSLHPILSREREPESMSDSNRTCGYSGLSEGRKLGTGWVWAPPVKGLALLSGAPPNVCVVTDDDDPQVGKADDLLLQEGWRVWEQVDDTFVKGVCEWSDAFPGGD